ncbi:hypothetical protein ES703_118053 [subsurface metagenome]
MGVALKPEDCDRDRGSRIHGNCGVRHLGRVEDVVREVGGDGALDVGCEGGRKGFHLDRAVVGVGGSVVVCDRQGD